METTAQPMTIVPLDDDSTEFEIINEHDCYDEDEYPFLGKRREHISEGWSIVCAEDYIVDIGTQKMPPTDWSRSVVSWTGILIGTPLSLFVG